jgi:hypothetical protein
MIGATCGGAAGGVAIVMACMHVVLCIASGSAVSVEGHHCAAALASSTQPHVNSLPSYKCQHRVGFSCGCDTLRVMRHYCTCRTLTREFIAYVLPAPLLLHVIALLRRWLLWQGNLQKSSPSGGNLEVAVPPGVTFECPTVALSR